MSLFMRDLNNPMLFLWILYDAIKFHVFSGVVNSGLGKKKIMASYAIVSCASTHSFYVIIMSNIMIIKNISAVGKDLCSPCHLSSIR